MKLIAIRRRMGSKVEVQHWKTSMQQENRTPSGRVEHTGVLQWSGECELPCIQNHSKAFKVQHSES
ncbi:hypothetical protein BC351_17690 [Paenibacillus ferrarius]|uniref:Uncharacterized protein n=1 Tax=Paenibacillus ferrarius TaxID=1469647 RepID=A0A1V4HQG2_9BACL|nr:hypothetical protein [Paenibacillus ferrarius]OPH60331.1 hypothetical protein BC351_17690 [Paenibacillus ferrarius]